MSTMPEWAHATVPQPRATVFAQCVMDEMVLYDGTSEMGYSLNASARAIWECCDGKRTIGDICHHLAEQYGVAPAELADDVRAAVEHFNELALLNLVPREAGASESSQTHVPG